MSLILLNDGIFSQDRLTNKSASAADSFWPNIAPFTFWFYSSGSSL